MVKSCRAGGVEEVGGRQHPVAGDQRAGAGELGAEALLNRPALA